METSVLVFGRATLRFLFCHTFQLCWSTMWWKQLLIYLTTEYTDDFSFSRSHSSGPGICRHHNLGPNGTTFHVILIWFYVKLYIVVASCTSYYASALIAECKAEPKKLSIWCTRKINQRINIISHCLKTHEKAAFFLSNQQSKQKLHRRLTIRSALKWCANPCKNPLVISLNLPLKWEYCSKLPEKKQIYGNGGIIEFTWKHARVKTIWPPRASSHHTTLDCTRCMSAFIRRRS